jgi:hypothetical protein
MTAHDHDHNDGPSRRKVLECMTWAGTGVLWTITGGVPHSLGLVGEAQAADAKSSEALGLTFLQISDSHMGFDKPANPNAKGTLEEAIGRIKAIRQKPAFMIHTGDITHLSKASEFDDAEKIISEARLCALPRPPICAAASKASCRRRRRGRAGVRCSRVSPSGPASARLPRLACW